MFTKLFQAKIMRKKFSFVYWTIKIKFFESILFSSYALKEISFSDNFETTRDLQESSKALEITILYNLRKLETSGHENVIKYYDFFLIDTDDKLFYLVLELCDVCFI